MTKENINLVEYIFYFNFKQFLQISIMNATFPIGGLGCALNPWLAEHFPYFSDLLDSCMLPWKLMRSSYIAMETNQYKYLYILFIAKVV